MGIEQKVLEVLEPQACEPEAGLIAHSSLSPLQYAQAKVLDFLERLIDPLEFDLSSSDYEKIFSVEKGKSRGKLKSLRTVLAREIAREIGLKPFEQYGLSFALDPDNLPFFVSGDFNADETSSLLVRLHGKILIARRAVMKAGLLVPVDKPNTLIEDAVPIALGLSHDGIGPTNREWDHYRRVHGGIPCSDTIASICGSFPQFIGEIAGLDVRGHDSMNRRSYSLIYRALEEGEQSCLQVSHSAHISLARTYERLSQLSQRGLVKRVWRNERIAPQKVGVYKWSINTDSVEEGLVDFFNGASQLTLANLAGRLPFSFSLLRDILSKTIEQRFLGTITKKGMANLRDVLHSMDISEERFGEVESQLERIGIPLVAYPCMINRAVNDYLDELPLQFPVIAERWGVSVSTLDHCFLSTDKKKGVVGELPISQGHRVFTVHRDQKYGRALFVNDGKIAKLFESPESIDDPALYAASHFGLDVSVAGRFVARLAPYAAKASVITRTYNAAHNKTEMSFHDVMNEILKGIGSPEDANKNLFEFMGEVGRYSPVPLTVEEGLALFQKYHSDGRLAILEAQVAHFRNRGVIHLEPYSLPRFVEYLNDGGRKEVLGVFGKGSPLIAMLTDQRS